MHAAQFVRKKSAGVQELIRSQIAHQPSTVVLNERKRISPIRFYTPAVSGQILATAHGIFTILERKSVTSSSLPLSQRLQEPDSARLGYSSDHRLGRFDRKSSRFA